MSTRLRRIGSVALILLVLSAVSCEEDNSTDPTPNPDENALPGVSYMGHGYDVFGEYAKSEHVKSPLLKYDAYRTVTVKEKSYNVPTAIEYTTVNTADFKSVYGVNSMEYMSGLDINVNVEGSYSLFSMSVTNNFSEKEYRSKYRAFCTIRNVIKKWKLTLPYSDVATLRSMLTDEAKADIATMAPEALFAKYGTHVITELIVGARADYNTCVTKCSETIAIKNSFQVCAEASFKKKSGSGSFNMVTEQQLQCFESNMVQSLKVSGGRSEYGSYIFQTGKYGKWIESIDNIENLTISDFTDHSLLPIWELCDDDARKSQLRSAFDTYAELHALPALLDQAVDGLYCEVSTNPVVTPQPGWTLINEDLNRDAGGRYIFLCYKNGLDDGETIADITFIVNNQGVPPGYEKVPTNLNLGAGGSTIYLCYKKGVVTRPIRRLAVLIGRNTAPAPGFYFAKNYYSGVKQDLNQDVGGNFIWLAFSYDLPDPWK